MKKAILAIVAIFVSISAFPQVSSGTWNSKTATYTNTTHKITWQLFKDWTWVGRPILTDDTLLKVRNDDTHILVSLSASNDKIAETDPWDYISMFESPEYTQPKKLLAKQNGMTYTGTKAFKSQICGIHAVKTRSDMKRYYPEHQATVHSIEILYMFYLHDKVYTVTVTALSVLEDEIGEFDRIATELFNGFSITQ